MYHVILAGGSGSRFWPQSRRNKPKQLINIYDKNTMIRHTVDRLKSMASVNNIMVVASAQLTKLIRKEIPEIPTENFIVEPSGKNTAPAIGLVAQHIFKKDNDALMGVYPADHLILEDNLFADAIHQAEKIANNGNHIVTVGISPTYPATGYGYIKHLPKENDSYRVEQFVEKPNKETATQYLGEQNYLWNGGIFVWKAGTILSEIKTHLPNLHNSLHEIAKNPEHLSSIWDTIVPESIDYGILEKSASIYVIPAKFTWSDLGSWKSLFDISTKNEDGNVIKGDTITINTSNSLVVSPNRLTALIGVKNLAVINIDNTTLIIPIEKAERVKEIVEMLQSMNGHEYL
jgi:mannose-1-phosphate guanylyltransferase